MLFAPCGGNAVAPSKGHGLQFLCDIMAAGNSRDQGGRMRGFVRAGWIAGVSVAVCMCCAGQTLQSKTDAEIKAEEAQARDLMQKQNYVSALPLCEDLHARQPQSLVYQEMLAMTLLGG